MAMQQYNLRDFEEREQYIRVVKPAPNHNRKMRRLNLAPIRTAAMIIVGVSLAISVLYSNMQLNEVTAQIAAKEAEIVELQSEYDYLSNTIESRMSIANVETAAMQQLGMIRLSASQIEYVTLPQENKVELARTGEGLFDGFSEAWDTLMEYIVP